MAYNQCLESQNVVHLLQNRESGFTRVGSQLNRLPTLDFERRFCKCFTPCLTIPSVDIPYVILHKFTPDGSQLLAFSDEPLSLNIYPYRGFSSVEVTELLRQSNVGTQESYKSNLLSRLIFWRLFAIDRARALCLCQRHLNGLYRLKRGFSVFLENGKYVLVVAKSKLPNEDSSSSSDTSKTYSYLFVVVDLKRCVVRDKLFLPKDSINVYHGISVSGSKIAIMSRLHQCIYIYEVSDGKLYEQETTGFIGGASSSRIENLNTSTALPITPFKQRVASFLYRQIDSDMREMLQFIEHMFMERITFISRDILLLRYKERLRDFDEIRGTARNPRHLYVFYTVSNDELVAVYLDFSVDLYSMLLRFYKEMHCLVGERMDIDLLFLMNSVSVSPSPYLKWSDFSYERHLSPFESQTWCSGEPIVFKDRATKTVKFRLFIIIPPDLCTFIWHPFDPLVLSIQKSRNNYVLVNVHLYHHGTVVEQPQPSTS